MKDEMKKRSQNANECKREHMPRPHLNLLFTHMWIL